MELLDAEQNRAMIQKLDDYQDEMSEAFKVMQSTHQREQHSTSKILGSTLTALYQRRIVLPKIKERSRISEYNPPQNRHGSYIEEEEYEEDSHYSNLPDIKEYKTKQRPRGTSAASDRKSVV